MADGTAMERLKDDEPATLTIFEAIERLEAGTWRDDLCVDLGDGFLLRADGPLGPAGLLQRLKGHALLLSTDAGTPGAAKTDLEPPKVRGDVKALLDAVKKAR